MFYARALLDMAEQFNALASKKKKKKWEPISKKHRKAIFEAFDESVGECIEHMDDKVKTPGAFCSSLKDSIEGTEWRKGKRKKKQAALWGKDWIKQTPDGTLFIDNIQLDRDKLNAMDKWDDLMDMGVSRSRIHEIFKEYKGHPSNLDTWLEQNSTPYQNKDLNEESSEGDGPLENKLSDSELHHDVNDVLNDERGIGGFGPYTSIKYPLTESGNYYWYLDYDDRSKPLIFIRGTVYDGRGKIKHYEWKTTDYVKLDQNYIFSIIKDFVDGFFKYFDIPRSI